MSIDAGQFLEYIVRPALKPLGPAYSTPAAEQLVVGTAAQESSLRWLRQVGGGPALGICQMEPATFRWLRDQFAPSKGLQAANKFASRPCPEPEELIGNLWLSVAYCRLRYIASPRPLPAKGDVLAQAEEWKAVYNSHLGAGKVEHYLRTWERLVAPAGLWR